MKTIGKAIILSILGIALASCTTFTPKPTKIPTPTETSLPAPTNTSTITPIPPTHIAATTESSESLSHLYGTYDIRGKNPDGTPYKTTLVLKQNKVFNAQPPIIISYNTTWGDGTTGYGLLVNGYLVISFWDSQCRPGYYINEDDMTMNAISLTSDLNDDYQSLKPTNATKNFDGDYTINSEDKNYNTKLTIANRGSSWQLSWTGNHPNEGIGLGIAAYHFLAVSSGGKSCGVRFYRVANDGSIDGGWAFYGVNGLGSDIGTR